MPLHRRSFLFCALVAAFLFGTRAFAQNAPSSMVVGLIKVANVQGTVKKVNLTDKTETALRNGDTLVQDHAVVTEGANSGVVLVFANGSTVKVGRDSRLEVNQFLMDPLEQAIPDVAALTKEPTSSQTNLRLEFGEIVGNVKTLDRTKGSAFKVTTPAGAAGIRGTTFRIVYRPTGTGQAFFQLSTSEGVVLYEGTTAVPASVNVAEAQEVVITAEVNPTTNAVTISAPTSASPISVAAAQELQVAAVQILQTQQQTTFTQVEIQAVQPPTPPPAQPPTPPQQQQQQAEPPNQAPRTTPGDGVNP